MNIKHFLTLDSLSFDELESILNRALELKREAKNRKFHASLSNHVLGMIFEKSSTRTRVSFETGMAQLGGHAIYLAPTGSQIGRGEPLKDEEFCDLFDMGNFGAWKRNISFDLMFTHVKARSTTQLSDLS